MNTRGDANRGELFSDTDPKPFRILALYDSKETSREARHASDIFLRELGDEIVVDNTSWDIKSLNVEKNLKQVAEEATRADVILIALSEEEPTALLKRWADEWQCSRELSNGLLALIPLGKDETGGELAEFLYETAVTANMDFLCRKKRRF